MATQDREEARVGLTAKDLQELKAREFEQAIMDYRNQRWDSYQDWKTRVEALDAILRGEYITRYADETSTQDYPFVQNTAQVAMLDMAKLASESPPAVRAEPLTDSDEAARAARVREVICDTHWFHSKGEVLTPYWIMDMAGAGGAFAVVIPGDQYPHIVRVDPRHAYPDVQNGILQDLLILTRMHVRQAQRLYPDLGAPRAPYDSDEVEIIDYYSPDEVVRGVSYARKGSRETALPVIVDGWIPSLGPDGKRILPAAFAQLPSHDGAFRGMFDQVRGSLVMKNRIVKLMTDYADQTIHAPFEEQGVINNEDPPGPRTIYHLDPNVQGAGMRRVAPAASAPQIFAILEFLDREQRSAIGYPPARSGDTGKLNIVSGSAIATSQGALTSTVKDLLRLQASMREDIHRASLACDQQHLDFRKRLLRAVDKKRDYTPGKDIAGNYDVRVVYGAGAGLDRLNADVRVLNHFTSGLISDDTARNQIDYLTDPAGEPDRIEKGLVRKAFMQTTLPSLPPDIMADVLIAMEDGDSLREAVQKVRDRIAAAQAQAQAPEELAAAPAAAPAGPEGLTVATGAQTEQEIEYPTPPLAQVLIGPPRVA